MWQTSFQAEAMEHRHLRHQNFTSMGACCAPGRPTSTSQQLRITSIVCKCAYELLASSVARLELALFPTSPASPMALHPLHVGSHAAASCMPQHHRECGSYRGHLQPDPDQPFNCALIVQMCMLLVDSWHAVQPQQATFISCLGPLPCPAALRGIVQHLQT